jgi:hypothetical protein
MVQAIEAALTGARQGVAVARVLLASALAESRSRLIGEREETLELPSVVIVRPASLVRGRGGARSSGSCGDRALPRWDVSPDLA